MRKKHLINLMSIIVILMAEVSCVTNHNLSSALSDINKHRVSQSTITNLEKAQQISGCEAESYYNLARIYHYNPKFKDLDKARSCYQKVISMYQMSVFNSQTSSLSKKYSVSPSSLQKTVKDVDELICTEAYANCLKSNRLSEYVKFVKKYPNSNLVKAAKDKAFELQQSNNTIAAYADYLNSFPDYRKDEVIQKAVSLAKTKKTMDAYCEFVDRLAEQVDDPGKLGLPIFSTVSDYATVYNRSLKNKNSQTRAKFTDQFINEQSNYCRGNEQRIRALSKQTPFPFELNTANNNTLKKMLQSVKVTNELVFYTEADKGFILHDGNAIYQGGISKGIRSGWGEDYYSNGSHYSGNYSQGVYHGTGFYYSEEGWVQWSKGWNQGVINGSSEITWKDPKYKKHTASLSGNYNNGIMVGDWEYYECWDATGFFGKVLQIFEKQYCDKTIYHYSNNGNLVSEEVIWTHFSDYLEERNSRSNSYSQESNTDSGPDKQLVETKPTSNHSAEHGTLKEVRFYEYMNEANKKDPVYQVIFYDDDVWLGSYRYAWVACWDDGSGEGWYYRKSSNQLWLGYLTFQESRKYPTQEEAINALRKELYGK